MRFGRFFWLLLASAYGIWAYFSEKAKQPVPIQLWAALLIGLLLLVVFPLGQWVRNRFAPITKRVKNAGVVIISAHGIRWEILEGIGFHRVLPKCPQCYLTLDSEPWAEDEDQNLLRVHYRCRNCGSSYLMPPTEPYWVEYPDCPPYLKKDILDRLQAERLKKAINR